MSINPLAWRLRASEGYRLSRPISQKVTDLLYVDDLKIYAASQGKLQVVMSDARKAMEDIGLAWNERKCAVAHVKRGKLETSNESAIIEEDVIESLKEGSQYKFLVVLENYILSSWCPRHFHQPSNTVGDCDRCRIQRVLSE